MARVFGVPVRMHFTFLMLLVLLLFVGIGNRQSGAMTALYVLALFASVLLHEFGHALAARPLRDSHARDRDVSHRRTFAPGAPAQGAGRAMDRHRGAAGERGAGGAFLPSGVPEPRAAAPWCPLEVLREPTDANLAQRLALGNLLLFGFNLLPAYPMDGGRILRACCWPSAAPRTRPPKWPPRRRPDAGRRAGPGGAAVGQLHAGLRGAVRLSGGGAQEGAAATGPHPLQRLSRAAPP